MQAFFDVKQRTARAVRLLFLTTLISAAPAVIHAQEDSQREPERITEPNLSVAEAPRQNLIGLEWLERLA